MARAIGNAIFNICLLEISSCKLLFGMLFAIAVRQIMLIFS
jgi:hypothetical protein